MSHSMPPGVDPRMFAFLQAQRQLQQQGQQLQLQQQQHQHQQSVNGHDLRHQQRQQQQQQHQHQQQHHIPRVQQHGLPQQHQGQRPGGDADVASFLLQLKTNQNGEPVTEAEALQLAAQRQVGQPQQLPQMPGGAAPQAVGAAQGGIPGFPHHAAIPGMYVYPGMMTFAQPNGNFAAAAAAAAMGSMAPSGYPIHQVVAAAAHQQQPGLVPQMPGIPGLNPAHQQQLATVAMHGTSVSGGSGQPTESSPDMTDDYIKSLITNDSVAENKQLGKNDNNNDGENPSVGEKTDTQLDGASKTISDGTKSAKDDMNIALVVGKDRDLIPDALFVALGQMKACRLQPADRVGCYKTRKIDFMGMSCKHCGGQPGFGRYFPNSVRSLAQTTTSQTILKHIAGKCRFCPPHIRKAVLELQRQQAHKEHMTTGRPRYGSRKIFFQRMWTRLHGASEDGEADVTPQGDMQKAAAVAVDTAAVAPTESSSSKDVGTMNRSSLLVPVSTAMTTNDQSSSVSKRSLPSEVSNNNTDDEEAFPPSKNLIKTDNSTNVISIGSTLNGSDNSNTNRIHQNKKMKIEGKEASASGEDAKKLLISPVPV